MNDAETLLSEIKNLLRRLVNPAYSKNQSFTISSGDTTKYTREDFGDDVVIVELLGDTTFNTFRMDNVDDVSTGNNSDIYESALKVSENKIIYGHLVEIQIASGGPVRLIKDG